MTLHINLPICPYEFDRDIGPGSFDLEAPQYSIIRSRGPVNQWFGGSTPPEQNVMKQFIIRTLVMVIVQPFAMYLFLRVLGCGFFVSGGLAALAAMLVGFGIYGIQSRGAPRDKSL